MVLESIKKNKLLVFGMKSNAVAVRLKQDKSFAAFENKTRILREKIVLEFLFCLVFGPVLKIV